jgi:hypothetical protein
VFGTSELLEQILLNVGNMKDLIRMRGVCHKWKDVIEGTQSLMQIIFLAPQQHDYEWHNWVRIDLGPPRYKLVKEPKTDVETEKDNPGILQSARINPLLFFQLEEHALFPVWKTASYHRWTSQELHLREGARLKGTGIRVSSSLLNMFATQPPVYEMSFRTRGDPARQIRNRKGIKVIDVLRVAEGLEGGLNGRVVIDYVFFPPEDVDVVYRRDYSDRFYARVLGK